MFRTSLLVTVAVLLVACSGRPDYSNLKVTQRGAAVQTGDTCSALGKGYNFYRYTCTGWSAPAERCFKTDAEANTLIETISYETGRACRLMEVIRSVN